METRNLLEKTSYDNKSENTTINDVIVTNKQTILELKNKTNEQRLRGINIVNKIYKEIL